MADTPTYWRADPHGRCQVRHIDKNGVFVAVWASAVVAGALVIEDPDKAVERMLNAAGDGWANATRQIMTRLLHAAGEGEI